MWLKFRKKERIKQANNNIQKLMAIRYTKEAWFTLCPESTEEFFIEKNSPNDILGFIKLSIRKIAHIGVAKLTEIQIITIDEKYIEWLEKFQKTHEQKNLMEYINSCSKIENYWEERFLNSQMLDGYHVVGISIYMILHEVNNGKSEYYLNQESIEQLSMILSDSTKTNNIYIPGWITKGSDMPNYCKTLVQFAKSYFDYNSRIRYGKYLEQNYENVEQKDLFKPFPFVIPIVIKTNQYKSLIYLNKKNNEEYEVDFSLTKKQKEKIYEVLTRQFPQIISIDDSLILPGKAYLNHFEFINS